MEKVLELLDEGRYTATYKYALLLALIDLCLEHTQRSGAAPEMVTTRQLADKIVELYWPHTVPFGGVAPATVLRQNTAGQAEIISTITRFRARHPSDPSVPRWESRMRAPETYERLVRRVEWKLIEMPLPRLQNMGLSHRPFMYQIYWDQRVEQREVTGCQRGAESSFDNRVMLRPGVGEYFLQLSGLLRPLIQRRWAAMVAQLNRLQESLLEMFLFGADRTRTARIRVGLWEMQGRRCFYCNTRIAEPVRGQVDHFVPWSRYPDDTLDNFVVADNRCNGFRATRSPPQITLLAGRAGLRRAQATTTNSPNLRKGLRGIDNLTEVSTSLGGYTCDFQMTQGSGFTAGSLFRRTPRRLAPL